MAGIDITPLDPVNGDNDGDGDMCVVNPVIRRSNRPCASIAASPLDFLVKEGKQRTKKLKFL